MRKSFHLASRKDVMRRSVIVAVVVGTILNIINQGSAIFGPEPLNITKCVLTYLVPFFVATYGAVFALMKFENSDQD